MKTIWPQINADEHRYLHSDLTDKIIAVYYDVYNELGHGFLESVYSEAMARALKTAGLSVERECLLNIWFRGESLAQFRADLESSQVNGTGFRSTIAELPSSHADRGGAAVELWASSRNPPARILK